MCIVFLCTVNVHMIYAWIWICVLWDHTWPQQSEGLSKVSYMWSRAFTLTPYKHTQSTHTHVHTAVWFLTVPECFYESFVVLEIRSELSPGRAALIMSLLKTGELPALLLSKHHLRYSRKGSPEKVWEHWAQVNKYSWSRVVIRVIKMLKKSWTTSCCKQKGVMMSKLCSHEETYSF